MDIRKTTKVYIYVAVAIDMDIPYMFFMFCVFPIALDAEAMLQGAWAAHNCADSLCNRRNKCADSFCNRQSTNAHTLSATGGGEQNTAWKHLGGWQHRRNTYIDVYISVCIYTYIYIYIYTIMMVRTRRDTRPLCPSPSPGARSAPLMTGCRLGEGCPPVNTPGGRPGSH